MITVSCPWCDAPVALERPDVVRCDDCLVEVELDPVRPAAEVPLAA